MKEFLGMIIFVLLIVNIIDFCKEYNATSKEWNEKVHACVLNENYRKDCKWIIYQDMKIHNIHHDDKIKSDTFASGMATGMAVGMR